MNPVIDSILQRRSVRAYSDRLIPQEERELIIQCAMRAPTAGNMMLYSIIEVTDHEKKEQLVKTCDNQPFIAKAPFVLLFLADMQRWYDYYRLSGVPQLCREQGRSFKQPEESDLMLACCDALIAAQNTVVAAESLGIGSCYIGDIMENYEVHRKMFQLPDLVFPITMLCFGYPKDALLGKPLTPRFPKESVVFTDTYQRLDERGFEKMFDERIAREFASGRYLGDAINPGQHFYLKKTGSGFMREMRRSVKTALAAWNSASEGRK
ncbi:nitroreductase family protein [Desulfosediminicola sp.]|uniref:nitroreductase family protein n=1 Tax=Desulfosediminicola sp. TaxID=2886825 RepID=UPI003AF20369